jgi:hypothetical protein
MPLAKGETEVEAASASQSWLCATAARFFRLIEHNKVYFSEHPLFQTN